jgi:hypothetical protein
VHNKYMELYDKLDNCQKKNLGILIRFKALEQMVNETDRYNHIIYSQSMGCDINSSFGYKPEYIAYFECYGYPESMKDLQNIDMNKIEEIRQKLINL